MLADWHWFANCYRKPFAKRFGIISIIKSSLEFRDLNMKMLRFGDLCTNRLYLRKYGILIRFNLVHMKWLQSNKSPISPLTNDVDFSLYQKPLVVHPLKTWDFHARAVMWRKFKCDLLVRRGNRQTIRSPARMLRQNQQTRYNEYTSVYR